MTNRLPLSGLTVIAVEQAVAAPFATSRLADAGATVIKIERPEGDFARGYDDLASGESTYFVWLNRGKRSVRLDLASPAGKRQFAALLESADVLVQNLKPGALGKLGFAPEDLVVRYPRLVACSISGYSEDSPKAADKAYDLLIQAETGLTSLSGPPGQPARVGISIVDIATGVTAQAAILEALVGRSITGQGADIRIAMFDVMADWLTVPLLQFEGGASPLSLGLSHPSIAPYGVFITGSGDPILIAVQNDREWERMRSHVLTGVDLGDSVRLSTNLGRVENRAFLDAAISRVASALPTDEFIARIAATGIAHTRVNSIADLASHPALRRIAIETPGGTISVPAPGPVFRGEARTYGAVPAIGECQVEEIE